MAGLFIPVIPSGITAHGGQPVFEVLRCASSKEINSGFSVCEELAEILLQYMTKAHLL